MNCYGISDMWPFWKGHLTPKELWPLLLPGWEPLLQQFLNFRWSYVIDGSVGTAFWWLWFSGMMSTCYRDVPWWEPRITLLCGREDKVKLERSERLCWFSKEEDTGSPRSTTSLALGRLGFSTRCDFLLVEKTLSTIRVVGYLQHMYDTLATVMIRRHHSE